MRVGCRGGHGQHGGGGRRRRGRRGRRGRRRRCGPRVLHNAVNCCVLSTLNLNSD